VNDRLYRSVDDRVLAGVAGGLADKLGIDPSIVRIVWALLAIASGGVFILIYIVMAIVVPEEDEMAPFPPFPAGPGAPVPGEPGVGLTAAPGEAAPGAPGAIPGAAPAAPAPPVSGWVQPGVSAAQWRAQSRAERRAARAARRANREPGQGALIFGILLILLGTWFLVREFVPWFDVDRLWPFALLILGVVLLAFSFGRPGGSQGAGGEAPR